MLNLCSQAQNPGDQLTSESPGQGQIEYLCEHVKEKGNTKFQSLLKQFLPKTTYHRMFKVPPSLKHISGGFFFTPATLHCSDCCNLGS